MVRSVAGDLPEQIKNNQSVNMAAGNGGQKNEPVLMVYRVRHIRGRYEFDFELCTVFCKQTGWPFTREWYCAYLQRRKMELWKRV